MRDVCCLESIDWTSKVLKKAWGLEAPLPGVMAQTSWLRSRGIKTQQGYFWFLLSPWRSVRVQDSQWSQVEHFYSAGSMFSWPFACIMYNVWRSTLDHPAGQNGGCRHSRKGLVAQNHTVLEQRRCLSTCARTTGIYLGPPGWQGTHLLKAGARLVEEESEFRNLHPGSPHPG